MPRDRISNANTRAVRIIVFSATLFGLAGCMSSPEQQLSRIETTAAVRRNTVAQVNQQQQPQDEIDAAVQADANDRSLDNFGVETQQTASQNQNATQPQGFGIQPKNIAATKNSIYSTAQSDFTQQGVTQKGNRVRPLVAGDRVAAVKSSLYANNSVEAVIAADNAGAQTADASQMPSYESLAERMAVPLPDADEVKHVQDVAMVGTEVPVLDPNAMQAANVQQQAPDTEVAMADPAMAQPDMVSALQPRADAVEQQQPRTLAAFFRKSDPRGSDKQRLVTRSIPNMQVAAIRPDSLPGVTTNAMFPTSMNAPEDDEHSDDEDDAPAGLMKLASLPSMTRIAPNGLYLQTDKVEVSCLRPELVSLIHQVENHYKRPAIITSGFRDPGRNRRSGGARHSLHTMCAAADIQIMGVSKWQLADYMRSLPGRGGVGTYCHTESVHIDVGGERDWNWRCRRKSRLRG